jgi:hypothetical protein
MLRADTWFGVPWPTRTARRLTPGPKPLTIRLRLVNVAQWTLSVQPTCTPRVGACARSVPSWAFPGQQLQKAGITSGIGA